MKINRFLFLNIVLLSLATSSFAQSDLIFKTFVGGCNSYIIGQGKEAVIIDAGANADQILEYVNLEKLVIKYIILTHGHDDHFNELPKLLSKLTTKIVMHQNDNGSLKFVNINKVDMLLKGGETLTVGNLKLEIIHTPGHTKGGICIKVGNKLFTGDTLFRESIGRTDSKLGNYNDLISSIKNKLMVLDDKVIIYPGHGVQSTIGYERANNPFLKQYKSEFK